MEGLSESDLSNNISQPNKKKLRKQPPPRKPPRRSILTNDDKASKKLNTNSFICKFCRSNFSLKRSRNRHEGYCSANADRRPPTFSCAHCNSSFNLKQNLTTHLKTCSPGTSESQHRRNKTPCLVKGCLLKFFFKTQLINHMSSVHKDEITIRPKVTKTFASIDEFKAWKEKEEESTFSYFSARTGQASKLVKHYYCQHDGPQKSHKKLSPVSSKCRNKGRVKVGHYCIAKIKVTVSQNKSVIVDYYPTHSHVCKPKDTLHHPLPAAMSTYINERLAENIPPTVVHQITKERFLPKNNLGVHDTKASILQKKLILERERRRRMKCRLHQDDVESVFLLAHEIIAKDNSLLIYKPCGKKVVHGPAEIDELSNSEDLFMFAFQTDRQLDLMKRYGSKIIIVGVTHGTNQCEYELFTVMVVDDNRRGWPVAHLITSKSDANTIKFFFQTLDARLNNEVPLSFVITDDDPTLINAANAGFSQEIKHILCVWHVLKNLEENLRAKVPLDLFNTMLSEIKVIMNTASKSSFFKLKDDFLSKYGNNPATSDFMSYLEDQYWKRVEKWSRCHRNFPHGEVNTIGYLDSFHNRLKTEYLKRKVNKRLDDLILILYDIERDDHCTRLKEADVGFSVQHQDILERHKRGLLMKDNMIVEQIEDRLWEIKSVDTKSCEICYIERCKELCNLEMCSSKCTEAKCHGLCSHIFVCSCSDHHPLCKHIHKLQSYLTRGDPFVPSEESFYFFETEYNGEELHSDSESAVETSSNPSGKIENILGQMASNISVLQQFLNAAQENAVPENTIIHVNTVLSDLVTRLEPEKLQN
ncbi:uncharacterized protein [Bemisia tabaci]|uniref:uncharacterized protein n=1 Tax=Bemisia tabaci TaxID=7038 RepID=UPI003B27B6F6